MLIQILKKCFDSKLVASCVLTGALAVATVVRAEYRPPADQKPPTGRTTGTVSRGGCDGSAETSLTALAPSSHVGQTGSPHPTFAWFVPDSQSYPLEFRLDRYDASGDRTRIQTVPLQSQPGMMVLSLPEDQPGLPSGSYRWQVVILCNPNRPSSALVAEADIDVVEQPSALAEALSTTDDALARANLYAESGFWYDALGEALEAADGATTREFQRTLLADLAALEARAANDSQHDKLKQIIETNGPLIYRSSSR
ncbi:MAG: DUF928 domain-containing protein [Cyanophyceae cyanobacterium]